MAFELMWRKLSLQLQRQQVDLQDTAGNDVSGVAFQFPVSALADAPLAADGMTSYACRFISDGRKTGEGAAAGTGVPAYYDPDTDSWLLFRDDSAVLT